MSITAVRHESVHYMVLPAPQFNSPAQQNFQISFSGEAIIKDFKGNENGSWRNDRLELNTWDMGWNNILTKVRGVLPPLQPNHSYGFVPLQWTVYASVNSQFDAGNSVNAGFGAWNFGINRGAALNGMYVDIQVADRDAIIYRIAYQLNVYGYFKAFKDSIIP